MILNIFTHLYFFCSSKLAQAHFKLFLLKKSGQPTSVSPRPTAFHEVFTEQIHVFFPSPVASQAPASEVREKKSG